MGRLPIAGLIPLMLFYDRKAIVYSIVCLQRLLSSGFWTVSFLNFELATIAGESVILFQTRLSRELKHFCGDIPLCQQKPSRAPHAH